MFRLFESPGFEEVWRSSYCHGHFHRCARYRLFQKGEKAPSDLLPNGERLPAPRGKKGG